MRLSEVKIYKIWLEIGNASLGMMKYACLRPSALDIGMTAVSEGKNQWGKEMQFQLKSMSLTLNLVIGIDCM